MDQRKLLDLIILVDRKSSQAYWATKTHCGGDFDKDYCTQCNSYDYCKNDAKIEVILKEIHTELEEEENTPNRKESGNTMNKDGAVMAEKIKVLEHQIEESHKLIDVYSYEHPELQILGDEFSINKRLEDLFEAVEF